MEIFYKILVLSGLMAFLYAAGSIYDMRKSSKKEGIDKKKIILGILFNMVKIILVFSIVCTVIIFVFLSPVMKLISL